MPRRKIAGKQRVTALDGEQELELLIGPRGPSAFASETDRRGAWAYHRAELVASCAAGMRPWGWWEYEARHQPAPGETDGEVLVRLGLATLEDRAAMADWRALRAG